MKQILFGLLFWSFTFSLLAQNPQFEVVSYKRSTNTALYQGLFVDNEVVKYLEDPANFPLDSSWKALKSPEKGWYVDRNLRRSYVYIKLKSDQAGTMLLNAKGVSWLYFDQKPVIGNRYQLKEKFESWEPNFGFVKVPVKLKKGDNYLLLRCNRGGFNLDFSNTNKKVVINTQDATMPDLLIGETPDYMGALVIINTSDEDLKDISLECKLSGATTTTKNIRFLAAQSLQKVSFPIQSSRKTQSEGKTSATIKILDAQGNELAHTTIMLEHRNPGKLHKRTYVSQVDGSVQYYAVQPSTNPKDEQALVLSVHGANVEAWNQSASYYPKNWAHIVSPTNRRAYGFNWEDWGRLDALAVLDEAKKLYKIDTDRVYLTGHSMGGHGTWVIGANHPDLFAAIAPSAGYLTIGRYYNSRRTNSEVPQEQSMLLRSRQYSLTDSILRNLKQTGIYILHGGADRVVPANQAQQAVDILKTFHHDFYYHEEPEVGHWWDKNDEDGADCVDWQPMFDFFSRKSRSGKQRIKAIEFNLFNPAIESRNYWLNVYQQEKFLKQSRVNLIFEPGKNRVVGQTSNVSVISIDPPLNINKPFHVWIDGDSLEIEKPSLPVYLSKTSGHWQKSTKPSLDEKGPHRYGLFKEVFNHNVVFVYGTQGTDQENTWAKNKAYFDAQSFWYQGNGSIEVIPDHLFTTETYKDRNVVLFGNRNTNKAWNLLLANSPVQVSTKGIQVGKESMRGKGKAILFIRPKNNSDDNLVGVVGGTDLQGMQLTNHISYMYQGFALPDLTIFNTKAIGGEIGHLEKIGFFGKDWKVESGEWESDK